MKILHITAGVGKSSFGVAPVVMGLAREQRRLGHEAQIWHLDTKENEEWAADYSGLPAECFRRFKWNWPEKLSWSSEMEAVSVSNECREFDILHHHGMWLGIARSSIKWGRRYERPVVIAPHGMLEPWALSQSALKKRLAYMIFDNANLQNAACLHACSLMESKGLYQFGLNKPIAVIPNAVDDSWMQSTGDRSAFFRRHSIVPESRVLLYMGRLAPIKGLEMLLEALPLAGKDAGNYSLVIAGSGVDNYVNKLHSMSKTAGAKVHFIGSLYGQEKKDAFASADVFVLPSYSENFGIAAAEALGAGLPTITTTGTPWEELVTRKCGWWVECNTHSLASAISEALAMPESELKRMGENGRRLVESKYTWDRCGKNCLETYQWLLHGGKHPECVRLLDEF